ncbi:FAD-dependent oxidoreductase [Nocardiopsis sediminis]|uniref:FAD-dependent oxidoreductase n=1 Tax=Nocardiopsis sediminis TaxID=1778267 RepID=A0ABV8FYM8_9ACTN
MTHTETHTDTTTVAISGGGPAGIMLGLLLARAGVEVTVLEKHGDFIRDFRGDTVHPSTLELLDELGLGEELERIPHRNATRLTIGAAEQPFVAADLSRYPWPHPYIALIPQWDFLNMLVEHARRYSGFRLLMRAEATAPIEEDGAVRGLRYIQRGEDGSEEERELHAVLTVSADGRRSRLRDAAGLVPVDLGAPMDVLWLRVSRDPDAPEVGLNGRLGTGAMAVAIDRGDYWQVAYLIPKDADGADDVRTRSIEEFQERLLEVLPFLGEKNVREIDGWDKVAYLEVGLDRLRRWFRPGYLCIGDAAHTMSPIGGVGINLAIQDAVASANLLSEPLLRAQADPRRFERTLNPALLARVQQRRWAATAGTQLFQQVIQRQVIRRVLSATEEPHIPFPLRTAPGIRGWSRVVARVMMQGIRPEHIHSPERSAPLVPAQKRVPTVTRATAQGPS